MNPYRHIEAEQAVLGAILVDPFRIHDVTEILSQSDFAYPAHEVVFKAMLRMDEMGRPIDELTLMEFLATSEELVEIGGMRYLFNLKNACPTAANVDHYAAQVKECSMRRQLSDSSHEIAAALDGHEDPVQVMSVLEERLRELSSERSRTDFVPIKDVLESAFERIEFLYNNQGSVTGIPSGFTDLDKMTSGFQQKDLIVVGARPSIGKTAFALNVAQNVALRKHEAVAVFSLEMGREKLVMRMLCAEGNIDANKMRTGHLDDDDWPRLTMAVSALADAPIFIDDTAGIKVGEIRAKCRRLKERVGSLGMVVIDYLQLVQPDRDGNVREQEVSKISRTLKLLAMELDCPVVALSQLSRSVEQRQDKRPILSDLRESGSIEQDADVVAFLYRDDYYNPESERKNIIEVIIAKQRSGPTGTVELVFLKNFNKFVNLDKSPVPPSAVPAAAGSNGQASLFDQDIA